MKNNTLQYYENNSEMYFNNTVDLDISNLYEGFTTKLRLNDKILDLGCGSGRDSLYFKKKGFNITAIDGSENLAKYASKLIGKEVIVSKFEELNLIERFNGVWACASLLHMKEEDLKVLLTKIEKSLEDNGVVYMSFKYGENDYIDDKNRYFNCYIEESITNLIKSTTSLKVEELFKTVDVMKDREDTIWLNIILLK